LQLAQVCKNLALDRYYSTILTKMYQQWLWHWTCETL